MKEGFHSDYLDSGNQELYLQLGQHIAYYRKCAHLTQTELAKRIQISRPYLCRIENSRNYQSFSMEILFDISRELNVDPYYFFAPIPENRRAAL